MNSFLQKVKENPEYMYGITVLFSVGLAIYLSKAENSKKSQPKEEIADKIKRKKLPPQ